MVSDKKLQKELGSIEHEFAKDASRLRKETLAIKQDYFKLKKEKGALDLQALQQLEFSPGLQERNTRSRRFGAFDPAMLKARDEEESPPKEDNRTFAERRKDMLLQKQLSSVPMDDFENEAKIMDPYKRDLDRILGNSKLAKEARLTALKVKALDSMIRPGGGPRRESQNPLNGFSDNIYRRSRISSMPVASTIPHQPHLLARRSMSDSLQKSGYNIYPSITKVTPKTEKAHGERVRKRSNSMTPTTLMTTPIDNDILRRRSDTPVYSGKIRLEPLEERLSSRNGSVTKLPDVVQN